VTDFLSLESGAGKSNTRFLAVPKKTATFRMTQLGFQEERSRRISIIGSSGLKIET
jgi:hypothetical protein